MNLRNLKDKYSYLLKDVSRNLFIVSLILIFLDNTTSIKINKFIRLDYLFMTATIFGIIAFQLWFNKVNEKKKYLFKKIIKHVFLFFLVITIISSLKFELLSPIQQLFHRYQFILALITLILGTLIFIQNRKFIISIKGETKKELEEEETRKKNFTKRFPRISKVFGVRCLIKWVYKEDWKYSIPLILLLIISGVLRFWNSGYLLPAQDEYYQINAAKRLITEGTFDYSRGTIMVYLISISYRFFGEINLLNARLITIIFSVSITLIIYKLGKKFFKLVGVISAYLWTFSPYSIGMSQYLREYSLNLFLILISVIILSHFYEQKKAQNSPQKRTGVIIYIILLVFLLILSFNKTIMGDSFIVYPLVLIISVISYFLYLKINRMQISSLIVDKHNLMSIALIFILIFSLFGTSYIYFTMTLFHNNENINYGYLNLFFNPDTTSTFLSASQWFSSLNIHPLILIAIFILPLIVYYKDIFLINYFLIFLSINLTLIFFVNRYFGSIYSYYSLPFYILILSLSISLIILVINTIFLSIKWKTLLFLIILIIFNPFTAINNNLTQRNGQLDKNVYNYRYDIHSVLSLLNENNFSTKDVVITSFLPIAFSFYYSNYTFIKNETESEYITYTYRDDKIMYDYPKNVFPYDYDKKTRLVDGKNTMLKIISDNPKGWIITRKSLNVDFLKESNSTIKKVGEVKDIKGHNIFVWQTN